MTVREFAVTAAVALTWLSAFGCQGSTSVERKSAPPPVEPVPADPLEAWQARAEMAKTKRDEQERVSKEAQDKLVAELKRDPGPVVALAVKAVEDYLPEAEGDERAKGMRVEHSETETFGGAKWEVRGKVFAAPSSGSDGGRGRGARKQLGTWEVDVRATDGKLRAVLVILN